MASNKSTFKLTINRTKIDQAAKRAFADLAELAEAKMVQVISEERTWPGFADARDIVDTGLLRNNRGLAINGLTAVYFFSQEYALYVHEGYTLRNGRNVPGRPWTTIALQEINVAKTFQALLELYLNQ